MKIRIATLLLTILCLALTASAGTIFSEGPIDGNDNGFYITGPSFPNPAGSFQDISNGFIAATSGTPTNLEFGEWVLSGSTPTSIGYEIGTAAFGTDLGSGTVAQNSSNSILLFTNGFGYGIYDVTIPVSSLAMTAGNEYWLSLSNASNTGGTQSGAWDHRTAVSAALRLATSGRAVPILAIAGWAGNPSRSPAAPFPRRPFLSPAAFCCSVLASWV